MKKIANLFFALTFFYSAFADTFIVTSNTDSGPGSLRQAILLANANGINVPDEIVFNILSTTEEGRTITLLTQLPAVSSNITIDGTTQTGTALGISNAKITLLLNFFTQNPFTFILIQNASDVKIFGICFRYFDNPDSGAGEHYAIGIRNSRNITIGEAGKGNLFSAVRFSITNSFWNYLTDSIRNVIIQGNVFGLNSSNIPVRRGIINLVRATEIMLGGTTNEQGNIFVDASALISQPESDNASFFLKAQNNKFSISRDGSLVFRSSGRLDVRGNVTDDSSMTKTYLLDNVFACEQDDAINLQQLSHKVIIQGNKLGTDITGTICLGSSNNLNIYDCKKVIVGGHLPEEQNIIRGLIVMQSRNVHLIKNQLGEILINGPKPGDPFAKIITYDNGLITGKSNPNAKIQLYTNTCDNICVKKKYLTTVFADNSGNWNFPYTPAMPNIVATATISDSSTSAFTKPAVNHLNAKVILPTCGRNNGSITGIQVTEGTHIRWLNSYNITEVVGTDTNLVNVPPGDYVLTVSNGENGCLWSVNYPLRDQTPPDNINETIINTSCGQNNGTIYVPSYLPLSYKWLNISNDSIGTEYYINNLPPGSYFLKAWIPYDTSCNKIYGPFMVNNQTGASIDNNNIQITPASCGSNNGSIRGITAINTTGNTYIQWQDSLQNPIGNTLDLLNIPPGKYRLLFKDAGGCDTIKSSFYVVPNNGEISIDTSAMLVTASKCIGNTGRIEQIKVTGGNSFQWLNTANNDLVSTSAQLINAASGNYQLTVTNSFGCTAKTPDIFIPASSFLFIGVTSAGLSDASCGIQNGWIRIVDYNKDSNLYRFNWIDSASGISFGNRNSLDNLGAGTYQLFATDSNGCSNKIYTGYVASYPVPGFEMAQIKITDDNCNLKEGSISSIKVNGLRGPTTYTWYDENNIAVGNNITLQNVGAGNYRLRVTDAGTCTTESEPFLIRNMDIPLNNPLYDNIQIPRNSTATLNVRNFETGNYRLYKDPAGTIVVQQNTAGNFIITNITTDTGFYIQRINGSCASPLTKVDIKVVDESFFAIPTAFTPNGDGKNDRLPVKVIGFIELSYFRIFNRFGELIYETRKLNDGWDGTLKGVLQNPGTFVWVAEGKDINGNLVKDKGSFVLIR